MHTMSSHSQQIFTSFSKHSTGSEISDSLSSESIISFSQKTSKGLSVRYKWTSNWEILVFLLACFIAVETFFIMPMDIFTDDPTSILNYVVFYFVLALPMVYMQIIVGQYSQLGVVFFKHLTPIGHGIGFVLCINTFWSCILKSVVMADVSLYLLSSLKAELPWMKCPPNNKNCWVVNGACTRNCFTPDKNLSAFVFWQEVYMDNVELETTSSLTYAAPSFPRVIVVSVAWTIIYACTRMRINNYKKLIMFNTYVTIVLFFLLLFVCVLAQGGAKGFELFSSMNWKALFVLKGWTSVVFGCIRLLDISKACYVVYGTYMDASTPSNILTIAYIFFHLLWILLGSLLVFACVGIIATKSHSNVNELQHIFSQPMPQLVLLPQALGYLGAPQLWSVTYFFICFVLLLNHQVIQVDIVERCITDINPSFKHYSDYILGALCLIGHLCAVVLVSKSALAVVSTLQDKLVIPVETFEVAIMYALICWVYGVQSFSDDIHFMVGTQPDKYWKICWYGIPVVLLIASLHRFNNVRFKEVYYFIVFIFCIIYVSLVPIMAVISIFHHLKRRNLIGVLQAQERWGPPDPRERQLRHLFNPREETRLRRRNEACKHKCFLGSKILNLAIEEQERLKLEDTYEMTVQVGSDNSDESDEG